MPLLAPVDAVAQRVGAGELDAEVAEGRAAGRREAVVDVVARGREAVLVRRQRIVGPVAADHVAGVEQRAEDGDAETAREVVVTRAARRTASAWVPCRSERTGAAGATRESISSSSPTCGPARR